MSGPEAKEVEGTSRVVLRGISKYALDFLHESYEHPKCSCFLFYSRAQTFPSSQPRRSAIRTRATLVSGWDSKATKIAALLFQKLRESEGHEIGPLATDGVQSDRQPRPPTETAGKCCRGKEAHVGQHDIISAGPGMNQRLQDFCRRLWWPLMRRIRARPPERGEAETNWW